MIEGFQPPFKIPYGVNLKLRESRDHNYEIYRSQVDSFPFILTGEFEQIIVAGQHTAYANTQNWSISMWASEEPNGISITTAFPNVSEPRLSAAGFVWNLFDNTNPSLANVPKSYVRRIDYSQPIAKNKIYYWNVQNLENKNNAYYLRFIFLPASNCPIKECCREDRSTKYCSRM
jgi:hypothetical protein